jgi:hypothetical protein
MADIIPFPDNGRFRQKRNLIDSVLANYAEMDVDSLELSSPDAVNLAKGVKALASQIYNSSEQLRAIELYSFVRYFNGLRRSRFDDRA